MSVDTCQYDLGSQVFCDMSSNGGGYTFFKPADLSSLGDVDVQSLFTEKSSFLMLARRTDGTQRSGVLKQLPQYSSTSLGVALNHNNGYTTPLNRNNLGLPYLFFGFLPVGSARNRNVQGIQVNGANIEFRNCDSNPNSYISLFSNPRGSAPSNNGRSTTYSFCDQIFGRMTAISGSVPVGYFQFAELHFGGCGCYSSTERLQRIGVHSVTIGIR